MIRILVTGGAGYIGSHVCKMLRHEGFEPITFDNLSTGHREFVKWGPLVEGDILDQTKITDVICHWKPAAVIHFAAFAYVGESVSDPAKYYRNNVAGSLALFTAIRDAGLGKIVFSSTCATYGTPERIPIPEDAPQRPVNPYGRTKLVIELMLDDFQAAYGMRSICLRYFNACGADSDGEIGELHDPEPHLIPRAILSVLGNITDFQVFGSDYPTPDGSPIRDYIHVHDLAAAHVAALRLLLSGAESDKINLGIGRGYSVKEIIAAVERITGHPVPHGIGPRRPGDPACLVADPSKAKTVLGFEPRVSDLSNIIGSAWRWHHRRHNMIKGLE
jgi:UDP-arabinose 4-epimerase